MMRLGNVKPEATQFLQFAVALAFQYICIIYIIIYDAARQCQIGVIPVPDISRNPCLSQYMYGQTGSDIKSCGTNLNLNNQ